LRVPPEGKLEDHKVGPLQVADFPLDLRSQRASFIMSPLFAQRGEIGVINMLAIVVGTLNRIKLLPVKVIEFHRVSNSLKGLYCYINQPAIERFALGVSEDNQHVHSPSLLFAFIWR
jgi:hypothetical protein